MRRFGRFLDPIPGRDEAPPMLVIVTTVLGCLLVQDLVELLNRPSA